ncbi:MAG: hypothetical protein OXG15_01460 [Gammaproteobacteria bacterium]|nr:hypothetical protein [Gammaproteobacteria bacterium]
MKVWTIIKDILIVGSALTGLWLVNDYREAWKAARLTDLEISLINEEYSLEHCSYKERYYDMFDWVFGDTTLGIQEQQLRMLEALYNYVISCLP